MLTGYGEQIRASSTREIGTYSGYTGAILGIHLERTANLILMSISSEMPLILSHSSLVGDGTD